MLVKQKTISLKEPFHTRSGQTLTNPQVAYEEYGNPEGPVILALHGGLSPHHLAGKYSEKDPFPGSWDALIGPDKTIDTNDFRVLSPNALGSMFGTTSPATLDPETGQVYGADFPVIDFIDMAHFHKAFLDELGVSELFLVCGFSMGGLMSLQLSALYPELIGGLVAVAASGRMTPAGMCMHHWMMNTLRLDPDFNQAKRSENAHTLISANLSYGLADRDPNCYITLLNAINSFDLGQECESYEEGVKRIKCPALIMNIATDSEFPFYWAKEVADILNSSDPAHALALEIESSWGHLGCVREAEKLSGPLQDFIKSLKDQKE
jgi:homoserine O-acetyltransferase